MRNRLFHYFLCSLTVLITLIVSGALARDTSAQFRVPIPRPRTEPARNPPPATGNTGPTQRTPSTATASSSANDLAPTGIPSNIIIDDGFTFFTLHHKKDYVGGKPISTGWSLVSDLRMAGPAIPKRSGYKIVVRKGGQALATTRCEGEIPAVPAHEVGRVVVPMLTHCYDDTQLVQGEGKFAVEVYFVNGDDDSERLARNYEIEVHKVDRVRGSVTKPEPDASEFYISRHGEVLSSILYLRPESTRPYVNDSRADTFGSNMVEIVYNTSTTDEGMGIGGSTSFVRCSVDGQRIELKDDKVRHYRPGYRYYQEIYTDRLAPEFKQGTGYKDEINFRQYFAVLPLTWGKQGVYQNYTKLEDHPGRWECTYKEGPQVVRTWRWTVRPDVVVAPHPEESAGLTLYPGAHLVETEIPAGGSFIDRRIFPPAAQAGFMYGHKWQTPEGKAMVAKVPAKGKPWPVPSTQR
ncbi:MAG TPA: hypothetical protein VIF64_07225 [Pyrinomonadaceae bacterium]